MTWSLPKSSIVDFSSGCQNLPSGKGSMPSRCSFSILADVMIFACSTTSLHSRPLANQRMLRARRRRCLIRWSTNSTFATARFSPAIHQRLEIISDSQIVNQMYATSSSTLFSWNSFGCGCSRFVFENSVNRVASASALPWYSTTGGGLSFPVPGRLISLSVRLSSAGRPLFSPACFTNFIPLSAASLFVTSPFS